MNWLILFLILTTIILIVALLNLRSSGQSMDDESEPPDFIGQDELEKELKATEEFLIKYEEKSLWQKVMQLFKQ